MFIGMENAKISTIFLYDFKAGSVATNTTNTNVATIDARKFIKKISWANVCIFSLSSLIFPASLIAYVEVPSPAINKKYETNDCEKLYSPTPDADKTLLMYGVVTKENSIAEKIFIVYIIVLIPNDFFHFISNFPL